MLCEIYLLFWKGFSDIPYHIAGQLSAFLIVCGISAVVALTSGPPDVLRRTLRRTLHTRVDRLKKDTPCSCHSKIYTQHWGLPSLRLRTSSRSRVDERPICNRTYRTLVRLGYRSALPLVPLSNTSCGIRQLIRRSAFDFLSYTMYTMYTPHPGFRGLQFAGRRWSFCARKVEYVWTQRTERQRAMGRTHHALRWLGSMQGCC